MYIAKTPYFDSSEPHLGSIIEKTIVEELPCEIRAAFYNACADTEALIVTIYMADSISGEDVELDIEDYLSNEEIAELREQYKKEY